jgi:ActR/RegA family two-component response regulator
MMTHILLVGADAPLLEGLAQTFAALGLQPHVASSIGEAKDVAMAFPPLVAVVDRTIAIESGADALSLTFTPGAALVVYRAIGTASEPLPYSVHRQVLADLTLPLERNRLVALVHHVKERAVAVGRQRGPGEPDRLSV